MDLDNLRFGTDMENNYLWITDQQECACLCCTAVYCLFITYF